MLASDRIRTLSPNQPDVVEDELVPERVQVNDYCGRYDEQRPERGAAADSVSLPIDRGPAGTTARGPLSALLPPFRHFSQNFTGSTGSYGFYEVLRGSTGSTRFYAVLQVQRGSTGSGADRSARVQHRHR